MPWHRSPIRRRSPRPVFWSGSPSALACMVCPPAAKVPGFIADAGWPQKLPNNWIIGQVGGLYVAPDDHIWIYQRPRTLTNDEAALTPATHKAKDGSPVDVL